jgi:hypothetical protein
MSTRAFKLPPKVAEDAIATACIPGRFHAVVAKPVQYPANPGQARLTLNGSVLSTVAWSDTGVVVCAGAGCTDPILMLQWCLDDLSLLASTPDVPAHFLFAFKLAYLLTECKDPVGTVPGSVDVLAAKWAKGVHKLLMSGEAGCTPVAVTPSPSPTTAISAALVAEHTFTECPTPWGVSHERGAFTFEFDSADDITEPEFAEALSSALAKHKQLTEEPGYVTPTHPLDAPELSRVFDYMCVLPGYEESTPEAGTDHFDVLRSWLTEYWSVVAADMMGPLRYSVLLRQLCGPEKFAHSLVGETRELMSRRGDVASGVESVCQYAARWGVTSESVESFMDAATAWMQIGIKRAGLADKETGRKKPGPKRQQISGASSPAVVDVEHFRHASRRPSVFE